MKTNKKVNKKVVTLKKKLNRHIKMTFVPHKSNQYRPHLIRRYGLAVVVVLVIGLQVGYNFSTTGRVLGQKEAIATTDLLADTNTQRVANQLAPLQLDAKLSQAAFLKGQDMFAKQYWAHQAPDGTTPWHWFNQAGYNYAFAGENLAKNFTTADGATVAWMASPEHRANILDVNYTQVGFAVVDGSLDGKPASIIVALYGEPVSAIATTAGVQTVAPAPHSLDFVTRLGVAVQSVSPAAIGALMLILLAIGVALMAHMYRAKLPKLLRQSWYRHHGLIKVGGMMSLCLIVLLLYSGGQI
ncbi:MAG: CAP domain-containing protein [Candidatus Saccharimonadales bacterium]